MAKPVILCVDDESMVLTSLKAQLREKYGAQYLMETADNALEAMEVIEELAEDGHQILVVVSDWLMPGMKGDEFLILVHERYPEVVKVMLTGQADQEALDRARQYANLHACIYKPWNANELFAAIQTGLHPKG